MAARTAAALLCVVALVALATTPCHCAKPRGRRAVKKLLRPGHKHARGMPASRPGPRCPPGSIGQCAGRVAVSPQLSSPYDATALCPLPYTPQRCATAGYHSWAPHQALFWEQHGSPSPGMCAEFNKSYQAGWVEQVKGALAGKRVLLLGDANTLSQYAAMACYLSGHLGLEVVSSEAAFGGPNSAPTDGYWHQFRVPELRNASFAVLRVSVLLGEWPASVTDWAAYWKPDVVVAAAHTRLSVPPTVAASMKPDIRQYLREEGVLEHEGLLRLGEQSLDNLRFALERGLNYLPVVVWKGTAPRHAHAAAGNSTLEDPINARLMQLNDGAEAKCRALGWRYLDVWAVSDEPSWHTPKSTINYAYPGVPDTWNLLLLDLLRSMATELPVVTSESHSAGIL